MVWVGVAPAVQPHSLVCFLEVVVRVTSPGGPVADYGLAAAQVGEGVTPTRTLDPNYYYYYYDDDFGYYSYSYSYYD